METTSQTLLQRVRSREDCEAWDRFVALYTPLLVRWAQQKGIAGEEVDDLVQEVFLLLMAKLPEFSYDPQRTFRGWLRTVAINKWREKRRKRVVAPLFDPNQLNHVADDEVDDALCECEYRQFMVARALEVMRTHFNETTWKACWETTVLGRPAAEVGRELGLSEGAVWVAKSRVLRRVRQELAGLMD